MDKSELMKMLGMGEAPAKKEVKATVVVDDLDLKDVKAPKVKPKVAERTALQLDEWSLRRGRECLAESKRLQKMELHKEMEERELIVADFHGAAFEPDPKLNEACIDKVRGEFMRTLLETPEYRSLHEETALNTLASEIATAAFAEQYVELRKKRQPPPPPGDGLEGGTCGGDTDDEGGEGRVGVTREGGERGESGSGGPAPTPEEELEMEMEAIAAVAEACRKASDEVEDMKDAQAACGMGAGGMGKSNPAKIAAFYARVKKSPKLRRICELAGRFRRVAQSKQRKKLIHGYDDVVGVHPDNAIRRLLGSELARLVDEDLELEMLRRFINRQTLCRDVRAIEHVAKGPIILCLDECLHPDELIPMADGQVKWIKDVKVGDKCHSVDFMTGAVITQAVARIAEVAAPEMLYRVRTAEGQMLCSGEHRFFVLDNGVVVEKQAKELKDGDMVAAPRHLMEVAPDMASTAEELMIAQVLGYLTGDGHLAGNSKSGKSVIATDKDMGNLEVYAGLFRSLGYKPIIKQSGGRNRIFVNNAKLFDELKANWPTLLFKSPQRLIPQAVCKYPQDRLAAFLRGLFDAESNVGDHQVTLTMSSKGLIDTLQLLLKRFGIVTERDRSASGFSKHDYHRLLIGNRQSLQNFADRIGYASAAKSAALHRVVSRPVHEHKIGRTNVVRVNLCDVLKIGRSIGLRFPAGGRQWMQATGNVTRKRLAELVTAMEERLDSARGMTFADHGVREACRWLGVSAQVVSNSTGLTPKMVKRVFLGKSQVEAHWRQIADWTRSELKVRLNKVKQEIAKLRIILNDEVYWSDIKEVSIEKCDVPHLYDLTMDGEHHNYVANNLVVHNSGSMDGDKNDTGKAIALAMAWIARHQKRWCALVSYSGHHSSRRNGLTMLPLAPGAWDEMAVCDWLESFLGGGSDMDVPIREMPDIYASLKAPEGKTDVIFITDAIVYLSGYRGAAEHFKKWKIKAQAKLISLIIQSRAGDLADLSDEVYEMDSLSIEEEGVDRCLAI